MLSARCASTSFRQTSPAKLFSISARGTAPSLLQLNAGAQSACWPLTGLSGKAWAGDQKQGFEIARRALHSKVEDMTIDVYDMSPEKIGKWDVVLFAGVLYHLQNPMLALKHAASVTGELLIVETAIDFRFCRRPAIAFYPGNELNDDPTNWCAPNLSALESYVANLRLQGHSRCPQNFILQPTALDSPMGLQESASRPLPRFNRAAQLFMRAFSNAFSCFHHAILLAHVT